MNGGIILIIKYNVSEQDYINFNIDHFYNSEKMKSIRVLLKFMPIVSVFIILYIIEGFAFLIPNIVVTVIFAFLWIVLYPKVMTNSLSKTTLKFIKEGKANDFIGQQSIELTEDYIEDSNSSIVSKIKYSTVERISFGHDLFYIYIGAIKAIVIPVSAFKDKEQQNDFFKILSKKTGLDISNIVKKDDI